MRRPSEAARRSWTVRIALGLLLLALIGSPADWHAWLTSPRRGSEPHLLPGEARLRPATWQDWGEGDPQPGPFAAVRSGKSHPAQVDAFSIPAMIRREAHRPVAPTRRGALPAEDEPRRGRTDLFDPSEESGVGPPTQRMPSKPVPPPEPEPEPPAPEPEPDPVGPVLRPIPEPAARGPVQRMPVPEAKPLAPAPTPEIVQVSAPTPQPLPASVAESSIPVAEAPAPVVADAALRPIASVLQASCPSCAAPLAAPAGPAFIEIAPLEGGACCPGRGPCTPGQQPCHPCYAETGFGQLLCGLYECICCPDPCYEPRWVPVAEAGFFIDPVRPVTQMRFRGDVGFNVRFPDRGEFFWPRIKTPGNDMGKGPSVADPLGLRVRYGMISHYTETALGKASIFIEQGYRSQHYESGGVEASSAGFTDLQVGTKSLLFDCELVQVAFQFRTYIPTGNAGKGLGTGHVSLEPSLLIALKLSCDTYLQTQIVEWIPIGGDPEYQGSHLRTHLSLNHVLVRCLPDVPLIGTFETNTISFQDGAFTDDFGISRQASGETYVSLGGGLRLSVCNVLDFGVGALFALGQEHFASPLIRTELRFRF